VNGPIAVVGGTGPEGRGLALRWARAGLHLIIGSREEQRACQAAGEIAAQCAGKAHLEGAENSAAVARADVVMLTVPFAGQAETLKKLKPAFRPNAILIDATVPLAAAVGGRATRTLGVWQGSAAQQAAELVPPGVAVVAAFHNVSHTLLEGDGPVDCDVIICTDHEPARAVAFELARMVPGVRPVDGGKLENARIVEQITALLIAINLRAKKQSAGIRITGLEL
jgi:8-hydroxy-5-deazaflavin:NADPH oxidoreductase